jgi:outer membrane protein assembly factor BamB
MRRRSVHRSAALSLAVALAGCGTGPDLQPRSAEGLFAAARAGDLAEARRLVESGIEVDAGNRYDETALSMAAGNDHSELVRYLLEQGADPDHRENFFQTAPLDRALSAGHFEVATLLLAGGADDREDALELALERGLPDLARAAVESGPIHESRLAEFRNTEDLDTILSEILGVATTRPDPEPPDYSAEQLERFVGKFEGWSSDLELELTTDGERLWLTSADASEPRPLVPVADNVFRTSDAELDLSFWGRAGTIEALVLERSGVPPESLRRSVAEALGPSAFTADSQSSSAAPEPTVNWPAFRGENASGIGDGIDTPSTWDVATGESIRWQVELPGLGNSSPIVWDDRVFVTTAVAADVPQEVRTGLTGSGSSVDEQVEHSWRVLAFDKRTGDRLWSTEIGRGVPLTRRHFKASQANSTPVTDGRRLVVVFPTAGLACLDLDGNLMWKQELGGLNAGAPGDPGMQWGFASSPILHGPRVILQVDIHDGPYLAAWELETGRPLWRTERDVPPSWATPSVLRFETGDELVVNGTTIHGYDPETGRELWSLGPNSELVVATPVIGEGVAYVSAGYAPVKPIYAVRAGTRGVLRVDPAVGHDRLLWSHERGGAYMPTPLLYRGLFYVVHHNSRIVAYDAKTGAAIYKSRFSRGGTFTGSPVAVNGKLYTATEEGLVYVLDAGPEYREIAVNDMGQPLMASPAVSEGTLLFRTPSRLVAVAHHK